MKSQPISQSRNNNVDIIRGLAMLMVVLQHTIVGTTVGFEDSLLFGMIWSLQMPLFFIISGYVTRYSRTIKTGSNLWNFFKKRSLAYLLPWLVWTVVIRGIIWGQEIFLDFHYLLWHMDSGYWFLVSLWCIVILYGLTDFIVNRFHVKSAAWSIVLHVCGMALGMGVLGGIGLMVGMDFLDIKLTIYYIPLFTGGYLYGQLQERISTIKYSKTIMPVVYALCLGIWLWILVNIYFYAVEMTPIIIAMRYIASIIGAIFIISCFTGKCKWGEVLSIAGVYSLEIYLTHYLFLNLLVDIRIPQFTTVQGFIMIMLNYTITLICTTLVILISRRNPVLSKILFFKKSQVA